MTGFRDTDRSEPEIGVVLLAAGRGERFSGPIPKQFLSLAGAPVFVHSLRDFANCPSVVEIALVVSPSRLSDDFKAELEDRLAGLRRPVRIVAGGGRRQDSIAAGLSGLTAPFDIAMIHDSVRPFPPMEAIGSLAREALARGAALAGTPCVDALKRTGPDGSIVETIDREQVWIAQTPAAIRADLVAPLTEQLHRMDAAYPDSTSALESLGIAVGIVPIARTNFKITTAEDLDYAEYFARKRRATPPA
jgi:2-C-methyl-D-erythritol 4-phosphate cytidylyltransferase